jgi:hypothetical protein
VLDMAGALDSLPEIPLAGKGGPERQAATGGESCGALRGAPDSGKRGIFPALRDNKAGMHRGDTERRGVKITGNNDGGFQEVATAGREKKDGVPYGIRTRAAAVKGRCPGPG